MRSRTAPAIVEESRIALVGEQTDIVPAAKLGNAKRTPRPRITAPLGLLGRIPPSQHASPGRDGLLQHFRSQAKSIVFPRMDKQRGAPANSCIAANDTSMGRDDHFVTFVDQNRTDIENRVLAAGITMHSEASYFEPSSRACWLAIAARSSRNPPWPCTA